MRAASSETRQIWWAHVNSGEIQANDSLSLSGEVLAHESRLLARCTFVLTLDGKQNKTVAASRRREECQATRRSGARKRTYWVTAPLVLRAHVQIKVKPLNVVSIQLSDGDAAAGCAL